MNATFVDYNFFLVFFVENVSEMWWLNSVVNSWVLYNEEVKINSTQADWLYSKKGNER